MLLLVLQQIVQEYYAPKRTPVWTQIKESFGSSSFWFKIVILVFCAPIWWPILKALVREIDAALRKDGGILARAYTPRDLKSLEERFGVYEDPLKSVPRGTPAERRAAGGKAPAAKAGGQAPPARGGSTGRSIRSQRPRSF